MTALRIPITHTRTATGLIWDVMFEITSGRGSSAARSGTPRVPDLGQVPEHDPGIMAPGLPPVITVPGGQRPDLDQHLLPPGGEPPRPVPAGRSGVIGAGGEGEPWAARRVVPVWFASSRGPGAAVPDRMPVLVGDRHAPGRAGVTGRSRGQVSGQIGVDRPDPAQLCRPVRAPGEGGLGDGQGDPCPANPGGIIPASGPPGAGAGFWAGPGCGPAGRRCRLSGCRGAGSPCRARCPGTPAPAARPSRPPGPPYGVPWPTR